MKEKELPAVKALLARQIKDHDSLTRAKREVARDFGVGILTNAQVLKIIRENKLEPDQDWRRLLRKREIRTMSGIAPVAVLTKPYPCPGKCAYCPTEKNVPQSYLSNEPAVMRAIRCGYDPFVQMQDRLRALVNNGHEPTKIEVIVIGGSWSALPVKYKYWFILNLYAGANCFGKNQKSKIKNQNDNSKCKIVDIREQLYLEQKKNEKTKYRIIGLTLETRPDMIDEAEIREMRELGCTRVELGVQATDDKILEMNRRGHGVEAIAEATGRLRAAGFKITYHFMPGLPGSSPAKDIKMYKQLFGDPRFQPDQIKFYPTVVTRGSLLYRWWRQGRYKPYPAKKLEELIAKCKAATPEYVRIIRLIRDIPGESIEAGNRVTNLRQVLKARGVECRCIRCREARGVAIKNVKLKIKNYEVSGGVENFISFESIDGRTLYGFCRLFLPDTDKPDRPLFPVLAGAALVRELHVYGELVSPGVRSKKIQHRGLGRKLLQTAEKLAQKNNYDRIAVIAGIGVRNYYRNNGYRLKNTYLFKKIA